MAAKPNSFFPNSVHTLTVVGVAPCFDYRTRSKPHSHKGRRDTGLEETTLIPFSLEQMTGIEPATFSLATRHSTS